MNRFFGCGEKTSRFNESRLKDVYGEFIDTSFEDATIAGHSLSWWVDNFGIPLHINYTPLIRKNIRAFKRIFEENYPNGKILYAAKAYCHPSIFRVLYEEGVGADVSSYNETKAALESGILPGDLNLNGNAKEDFLITQAVEQDILITIDSMEELDLVSGIASSMGKTVRVLLRVSGFESKSGTDECILTSGVWTKFGISPETIKERLKNAQIISGIKICGLHMHVGSQIARKEDFLDPLGVLIELGHFLRSNGHECSIINIGGGFPLSYMNETEWSDFKESVKIGMMHAEKGDFTKLYVWNNETSGYCPSYGEDLEFTDWKGEMFYSPYPKSKMLEEILKGTIEVNGNKINTIAALKELGTPQILIEPGRSIVGDTGITLARVSNVKKIAYGHNLLVLEMGVVNYAGSVIHKLLNGWSIVNDYTRMEEKPFEAFVCGNLCYNGDIIAKYKIKLQRTPKRGDIVMIYDTGGTESHFFASNANSYPCPSRVLVDENGSVTVVKRRDSQNEIFGLQELIR